MKKFPILGAAAIGATMTRLDRPIVFLPTASAFAVIFVLSPVATQSSALAAGVPPFCVARGGGSEGAGISRQICSYFDYQACLQAAADLRGNCVQNIDYHGEVSTTPATSRARQRH
jgi:hypothetical protein